MDILWESIFNYIWREQECFSDPVVTSRGQTYEKGMLEEITKSKGLIDPFVRQPIRQIFHQNKALLEAITHFSLK